MLCDEFIDLHLEPQWHLDAQSFCSLLFRTSSNLVGRSKANRPACLYPGCEPAIHQSEMLFSSSA